MQITVSESDNGQRLDRWLKRHASHIPYHMTQKLLRKGAIKIDGKKAKPEMKVSTGQEVYLPEIEEKKDGGKKTSNRFSIDDQKLKELLLNHIIYEDEALIAINKPPGLAAQGGTAIKYSVADLLVPLSVDRNIDIKLVHRIDKDTSGVMLLAKGRKHAEHLGKLFKDKALEKIYWAIVVGVPEIKEGSIDAPLGAKRLQGKIEKAVIDEEDGKRAITHYRILDRASDTLTWLELQPETGRMHQLRIHMQAIGHPILGDGKYGGKDAFIHGLSNNMHLHARQITIPSYAGKTPLVITADLPKHMQKTFNMFDFSYN